VLFFERMTTRKAAKRDPINTGSAKRYVRRNTRGRFMESDDVRRSLAKDRGQRAKTTAKTGQGDRESVSSKRSWRCGKCEGTTVP
jgi:hypothetical protein